MATTAAQRKPTFAPCPDPSGSGQHSDSRGRPKYSTFTAASGPGAVSGSQLKYPKLVLSDFRFHWLASFALAATIEFSVSRVLRSRARAPSPRQEDRGRNAGCACREVGATAVFRREVRGSRATARCRRILDDCESAGRGPIQTTTGRREGLTIRVDPRTRHWRGRTNWIISKNPTAAALPPASWTNIFGSIRPFLGWDFLYFPKLIIPQLISAATITVYQTERCSSGWKRRPPARRGRLVPCLFVVANGKSEVPPKGHQAGGANRFVVRRNASLSLAHIREQTEQWSSSTKSRN